VTQIKYYLPDVELFYGYCNKARYYCTWDINTNCIGFVEESAYNVNLSNMNTVSALGLDDMTLTMDPAETSEDPTIARKFAPFLSNCSME